MRILGSDWQGEYLRETAVKTMKNRLLSLLASMMLLPFFGGAGVGLCWAGHIHPNSHIIYELNLYNFTAEGTLAAAEQRLDAIKDLGVDVVWLMPIHPRSKSDRIGKLGSPYAPADYTAVNPDFGTLDDLRHYVRAAHDRGMQVWLDWVPNHTGTDNVWTKSHPEYYQQKGGAFVHPNNYGDVLQLNYGNTALQDAMIAAMQYWIDEADVDGFRLDYVSSSAIPAAFFTKAIDRLTHQPDGKEITMMGEADMGNMDALRNTGWDYDYAWAFHTALCDLGSGATANTKLKPACQRLTDNAKYKSVSRMVYLTNHDQNYDKSLAASFGGNVYAYTALMMTLYGMPCIYNGQENGFLNDHKQDYFNRAVIDWNMRDDMMISTLRVLGRLHHASAALRDDDDTRVGGVKYLDCNKATCMAYVRTSPSSEGAGEVESVLVVLNLSNNAITVTPSGVEAGTWQCVADSRTITTEPAPYDVQLSSAPEITVGGKGFMVFSKGTDLSGISTPTIPLRDAATYDLSGRRVSPSGSTGLGSSRIYISNGRKVVR